MYRIGFIIVMILAVALGLLIGTLNHEVIAIDLLWFQLQWPLGLALLAALSTGILIGLALTWLFSVLPMRMMVRKTLRSKAGNANLTNQPHD